MEDEDFRNFNPRKFWADHNNELVCGEFLSAKDLKRIDRVIAYLKVERSIAEMIRDLGHGRGEIIRIFGLIRNVRGVSLERKEPKPNLLTYRVVDFRSANKPHYV